MRVYFLFATIFLVCVSVVFIVLALVFADHRIVLGCLSVAFMAMGLVVSVMGICTDPGRGRAADEQPEA